MKSRKPKSLKKPSMKSRKPKSLRKPSMKQRKAKHGKKVHNKNIKKSLSNILDKALKKHAKKGGNKLH